MQIQWYPGHMTKTKRMLTAQMGLIDVVVEILDARVPLSSRNPDIDSLAKGKKRILVLNKADLANAAITAQWEEHFRKLGFFTLPLSAKENDKKKSGIGQFTELLKKIMEEKAASQRKRGRINVPTRAMIVGIPNVGKSTFINLLAGRASTATADRPGVTRGRQWIKVGTNIDLMDTPGVLWPKFEDPEVGLKLACTGAVSDNVVDKVALAENLIQMLMEIDPKALETRYKIKCDKCETPKDRRQVLTNIGEARGFKMKGGVVDIERAAIILLDEYRGGKLGRITLERP
ncbi:MAG: ribosome biogenesis GTPase YlqF [Firmicutes bacterium]|nr:ribosome biogenesis GTPase YlqF [Bacillota bacterium]